VKKISKKKQKEQLIFFNDALDYFESNYIFTNEISQEKMVNWSRRNLLRDEMLSELDNLKEILSHGLTFKDLDDTEKEAIYNFMSQFSRCPICRGFNHARNLKEIYFNKEYYNLIKALSRLLEKKRNQMNLNIDLGIPCCICYKSYLNYEDVAAKRHF